MTVGKHIEEDDLALFALALMPGEEAAFTEAHLRHCDLCRAELARLQGDLVHYAMTAPMEAPPARARERFLAAVAEEHRYYPPVAPAPAPQPVHEPTFASRSSDLLDRGHKRVEEPTPRTFGIFAWAGWALAASLAGLVGWQFYQTANLHEELLAQNAHLGQLSRETARAQEVLHTLTDPQAMQVALRQPATPGTPTRPEAHASYNSLKGSLVFVASHLQPLDPEKSYELWLLPANGQAPVPAGLFKPDMNGNASVVLPELPQHVAAKGFGVTVEDEEGAKAPTPPIVLAGM